MLLPTPRLYDLLRVFVATETASAIRHEYLNKVTGIGTACFSLRRELDTYTTLWSENSEIPELLSMLKAGIAGANGALTPKLVLPKACTSDPVNVAATLAAFVAALKIPDNVSIEVDVDLPHKVGVASKELELALHCLVENALDAVELANGGTIVIRSHAADNGLRIEVSDDGPGFASGVSNRALDPFFTTKENRVGLGLNIARRIAGRLAGRLELDTRAPTGVRATLMLPIN